MISLYEALALLVVWWEFAKTEKASINFFYSVKFSSLWWCWRQNYWFFFSESKDGDGAVKRCDGRRDCDFNFECFNFTFYPKKCFVDNIKQHCANFCYCKLNQIHKEKVLILHFMKFQKLKIIIGKNIFACLFNFHNEQLVSYHEEVSCIFNETTLWEVLFPSSGNVKNHIVHIWRKYANLDRNNRNCIMWLIKVVKASSFTNGKVMSLML